MIPKNIFIKNAYKQLFHNKITIKLLYNNYTYVNCLYIYSINRVIEFLIVYLCFW